MWKYLNVKKKKINLRFMFQFLMMLKVLFSELLMVPCPMFQIKKLFAGI